jgi:CubicO group peptidase (beta-lactamase class C family)
MNVAVRMKHYNVPGVSIAVINNGKVEWAKGYGVAEIGTNVPVTAERFFRLDRSANP